MTHLDQVDMGEGYTKFHTFGLCNGTPFYAYSRDFHVLESTVSVSDVFCLLARM